MKEETQTEAKTRAGAAILRKHRTDPIFTPTGRLSAQSRKELNRLHYYWYPGLRKWRKHS